MVQEHPETWGGEKGLEPLGDVKFRHSEHRGRRLTSQDLLSQVWAGKYADRTARQFLFDDLRHSQVRAFFEPLRKAHDRHPWSDVLTDPLRCFANGRGRHPHDQKIGVDHRLLEVGGGG